MSILQIQLINLNFCIIVLTVKKVTSPKTCKNCNLLMTKLHSRNVVTTLCCKQIIKKYYQITGSVYPSNIIEINIIYKLITCNC